VDMKRDDKHSKEKAARAHDIKKDWRTMAAK
jgi:hypothetical protein